MDFFVLSYLRAKGFTEEQIGQMEQVPIDLKTIVDTLKTLETPWRRIVATVDMALEVINRK